MMVPDWRFRDLMAGVCSPVSVITTAEADTPHGSTVSSLAALSLRPALVSVALDRRSRLLERIVATRRFGANILSADQDAIATAFARSGTDRFGACSWSWFWDLPRLDGAAGWAVCDLWQTWEAGDHVLLAGQVQYAASSPRLPLVYGRRTYGTHSSLQPSPHPPITELIAACTR